MPIYIPPLVKKVAVGTIPTVLNDLADVIVSAPVTGDSLVYNGTYWISHAMATKESVDALRTETIAASSSLQTQINTHTSNISSLQLQINQLTTGIKIVFSEQFSGNGVATTATLNGTITNGSFATGAWSNTNIANTLPAYVTDLSGKPIYNSANIFTRTKISVVSISGAGVVTLSAAPLNGQSYKIWYFYSLQSSDKITNYYRDDFVADMETEATSIIASQVQVSTAAFNGILSGTDTTLQIALDTIDDHVHNQYILSSNAALISSNLQTQINSNTNSINNLSSVTGTYLIASDLQPYALTSTVATISGGLNTRLTTVEGNYATKSSPTSGTYNNVTINSQGIVISGGNINYTLLTETQATSSYLYSLVASMSGSGTGFTPLASTGILVSPSGSNYSFALDTNYTDNRYTTKSETASISGDLQGQIDAITVPTSATFLIDYDNRYVNIVGDTMTGTLSLPKINLVNNNVTSSVSGDFWHYEDTIGEGNGFFINAGGNVKQIDFDSNTVGPIAKITITDNGNGTINVPTSSVFLYSNSGWTGNYRHYHIPAVTNVALTDNSINYLVADYNSGSPIYSVTTNPAVINNSNIALVATMSRYGTEIHWIPVDWGPATAVKLNNRQINIARFERSSGLMIGETTGRVITATSGVIWYGSSSNAESAVDSSSNNCDFWYHSAGNWTKSIVSTYNNSQYDNGTDLVTLSGPGTQYAVNWVYRYLDGAGLPKLAYVVGTGNYNLNQALASTVPTIPVILDRTAILIGRIIVAQGSSTAYQITSAFTQVFAGSSVTDHNDLGGLQGGTTDEYYHLTSAQYNNVANDFIGASTVASISASVQTQLNGKANTSHTHTSGDITDFNEAVYDNVATNGMLVAGANITFNYDDINNQLTINSSSTDGTSGMALLQGEVVCDTINNVYRVSHLNIDINYSYPVVNLEVPTSGSNLFIQGITNRTTSYFDVVLSEVPNISGYGLLWHLPVSNSNVIGTAVVNQQITSLPSTTTSVSGNYAVGFTDTVVYVDVYNTVILPASPVANEHHWFVNIYGGVITVNGNGKLIGYYGDADIQLETGNSAHMHFNSTKDRWYIL